MKSIIEKGTDKAEAFATYGPWTTRHPDNVTQPLILAAVKALRDDPSIGKIGAVGFCWGGRQVALLGDESCTQKVDAIVSCHPAGLAIPSEVENIVKPISIQVGEIDSFFDKDQAEKVRQVLMDKKTPYEVVVYNHMIHGFAVRGDLSKKEQVDAKERCLSQTINWFNVHLA
ncbi:AIM2 [Acrasis kona]|uniref:AIM2 n=1 Tax=Acrasis kona TaxID=1008807 RepID=A0AAW2ZJW7_9EUKA